MTTIPLTRGKVAWVDDDKAELVLSYHPATKWRAIKPRGNAWYAANKFELNGKEIYITMHRLIMGITDPNIKIDHINATPEDDLDHGLNNQLYNLRIATNNQNSMNGKKQFGRSSQYKGVNLKTGRYRDNKRWYASIRVNSRLYHIGSFKNEIDAARAYDKAAKEYFGEFARLNLSE